MKADLPIIVGKNLKKGLWGFRDGKMGGYNLCIVWLKQALETGKEFDLADIDKINAVIHFCDRDSVQNTVNVLNKILKDWKEPNDES